MRDDFKELFSNDDDIKELDGTYIGEYQDMAIKEKYAKYPKIKYPLITLEEISNEDFNQFFDDSGENISYIAVQIEINCEQDEFRTSEQNVRRVANIIDKYLKGDRYRCLRRIGGLTMKPLPGDNNVMTGYMRYECNVDIKTNTIYRRY